MGKVKETGQITLHNGEEKYQSPMGKVKLEVGANIQAMDKRRYQSPMGKVKNNILPCGFIIYTIYRFVKRNFELFV